MSDPDQTVPGDEPEPLESEDEGVQMVIGPKRAEQQRKANEARIYKEAQETVIDPLNEELGSDRKPGEPAGDGISPGTKPDSQ